MARREYVVLYTHQKTKKSKIWQDGKLKFTDQGHRAVLFDAKGSRLELVYLRSQQIAVGEEIESERHLITIEEVISESREEVPVTKREYRDESAKPTQVEPLVRNSLKRRRTGFKVPRQVCKKQEVQENTPPHHQQKQSPAFSQCFFSVQSPLFSSQPSQNPESNFEIFKKREKLSDSNQGIGSKDNVEYSKANSVKSSDKYAHLNYPQDCKSEDDSYQGVSNLGVPIQGAYDDSVQSVAVEPPGNYNKSDEYSNCNKSDEYSNDLSRPDCETDISLVGRRSKNEILALLGKKKNVSHAPSGGICNKVLPKKEDDVKLNWCAPMEVCQPSGTSKSTVPPIVKNVRSRVESTESELEMEDTASELGQKRSHDIGSGGVNLDCSTSGASVKGSTEEDHEIKDFDTGRSFPSSLATVTCKETNLPPHSLHHSTQDALPSLPRRYGLSASCKTFRSPVPKELQQLKRVDGKSMHGPLFFPSCDDVINAIIPQRGVQIPVSFPDVATYKQILTAALREHLNILLFEKAQSYHYASKRVDTSNYSVAKHPHQILHKRQNTDQQKPPCQHNQPSRMVCVRKEGPNKGRFFYICNESREKQCKFFQWADEVGKQSRQKGVHSPKPSNKRTLNDPKSIEMYVQSYGLSLYCECEFIRKDAHKFDVLPGAPAWVRKYKANQPINSRKKLYLKLSRKERGSAIYGKDDLWVISQDLSFYTGSSFLAKSAFYGPNSACEVEVEPISGYNPSNWNSSAVVHALHLCHAAAELTCLNNIEEFINPRTLPILPALLSLNGASATLSQQLMRKVFKSPCVKPSTRKLLCLPAEINHLTESIIDDFHLNIDQSKALRKVAAMFGDPFKEETSITPISLIHGVFGAGKSYLLAVTVIFLVQLFELHQKCGGTPQDWKILIASTTNVAVDRILLSLLDMGFEDFVRVGSVKKIAKPILPHSVHASDKNNQELHELQEMLRGDLTPSEKLYVRKTIDRQRLGQNKDLLSKVLVVGVTCAACSFPCIASLKFPMVLLDECSQITEPGSLLPIARFECERLVLVGDPKQLDPTIQGSESPHTSSLEQTLFDRLILLGYEPTLLRTQYRCHPHISAISNELFYDSKLVDGVTEADRLQLSSEFPTLSFYDVADGKECIAAAGGSFLNDKEANFVISMIEMLMFMDVEPTQIGVITLYKAQVALITTLLQQSSMSNTSELKAIQVSTVDAFQGGEKDIIILSCVRTDSLGFIDSDKRTNVALTRSRHHLLIVGHLKILSKNNLWGRIIAKCRGHNNGVQRADKCSRRWKHKLDEFKKEHGLVEKKKRGRKICGRSDGRSDEMSPPQSLPSEEDDLPEDNLPQDDLPEDDQIALSSHTPHDLESNEINLANHEKERAGTRQTLTPHDPSNVVVHDVSDDEERHMPECESLPKEGSTSELDRSLVTNSLHQPTPDSNCSISFSSLNDVSSDESDQELPDFEFCL